MEFDAELCARYVETLVNHDEVERALWVLDNLPAYFRDNMPANLQHLRHEILAARYTAASYVNSNLDDAVDPRTAVAQLRYVLRGRILEAEVRRYNERNKTPHIVEMGPGTYFIPQALSQLGLKFTYWDLALNANARTKASDLPRCEKPPASQPAIFVALEIIEHLAETRELAIECAKHCPSPERIHLSTPLFTFDSAHDDWRTKDGLPHLRAYTPNEFIAEALNLFPGYHWELMHDRIMSLRGQRVGHEDPMALEIGEQHGT